MFELNFDDGIIKTDDDIIKTDDGIIKTDDGIIKPYKIPLEYYVIEKHKYNLLFEGKNIKFLYNNIKWQYIIEHIICATFEYIIDTITIDDLLEKHEELIASSEQSNFCANKGYKVYEKSCHTFNFYLLQFVHKIVDVYNGFLNKYIGRSRLNEILIRNFKLEHKNLFAYYNLLGLQNLALLDYYYQNQPFLNYIYYKCDNKNYSRYYLHITLGVSCDVITLLNKIKPYLKNGNEDVYKDVYEVPCSLYKFFNETDDKRNCRIAIELSE
jgi:hypothetical protein